MRLSTFGVENSYSLGEPLFYFYLKQIAICRHCKLAALDSHKSNVCLQCYVHYRAKLVLMFENNRILLFVRVMESFLNVFISFWRFNFQIQFLDIAILDFNLSMLRGSETQNIHIQLMYSFLNNLFLRPYFYLQKNQRKLFSCCFTYF